MTLKEPANGWRFWRLVENQAQKRDALKVQTKAKKREAYQPSSARCVSQQELTEPSSSTRQPLGRAARNPAGKTTLPNNLANLMT